MMAPGIDHCGPRAIMLRERCERSSTPIRAAVRVEWLLLVASEEGVESPTGSARFPVFMLIGERIAIIESLSPVGATPKLSCETLCVTRPCTTARSSMPYAPSTESSRSGMEAAASGSLLMKHSTGSEHWMGETSASMAHGASARAW